MPGNRAKGNTASFTEKNFGMISVVNPSSGKVLPAMTREAILAKGLPMALLTKGTVREARGFTSST